MVGPDGRERFLAARHVVVAAGAIETPRLLLLSGFDHPLIGRYLMTHFQTIVAGGMPFRTYAERGRAVTHVHDDMIVGDDASRRAAAEGGLPWVRGGLVEHSGAALPILEANHYPWGASHTGLMADSPIRGRLWAFIMQGEDLPYPTNRVDLDPTVRDVRGFPVARVTYRAGRHEHVASDHYGPRLAAILKEMGAEWTAVTDVARQGQRRVTRGRPGEPPQRRDRAHGERPVPVGGRSPGADARPRERRGGRLLGVRHLRRLRTHAHPGGAGRPGRPPPGRHRADIDRTVRDLSPSRGSTAACRRWALPRC